MDARITFIRTPMGRESAVVRMLRLSAEQRWLLELIDGKRTVAQLELLCSDLRYGHTALDRLALWGLIAPLTVPAAVPSARAARQVPVSQEPVSQVPVSQEPVSQEPVSQVPVSRRSGSGNDAQLLARMLSAKPVAETLLTRAALGPAPPNRAQRRA
jgi:hypothetical protein